MTRDFSDLPLPLIKFIEDIEERGTVVESAVYKEGCLEMIVRPPIPLANILQPVDLAPNRSTGEYCIDLLSREFLQALREKAYEKADTVHGNIRWRRVYLELAGIVDTLDAMWARCEVKEYKVVGVSTDIGGVSMPGPNP
jgi:hypothetical protein